MKKYFITLTLCFIAILTRAADDKNIVKAKLTAVTVYKIGAEMTHAANALLSKGNNELIIENISNTIDLNSLQINCNGTVTIMGIEFNKDYLVDETKTPTIIKIEDSIKNLNEEIEKIAVNKTIITDLLDLLKTNKDIKGTQSGLNIADLVKMVDYYKAKSVDLQGELSTLIAKETKFNNIIDRLTSQLKEEQKKNTKTSGRLILQINNAVAGKFDFTISYITQNAFWVPFYDIKADNIKSPLKLIYRAKVFQTTGLDWKQVKLNISTSAPNLSGNAPTLNTWFAGYKVPDYRKSLQGKAAGLSEVVVVGYATQERKESDYDDDSKITIRGSSSLKQPNPLYIVNGEQADNINNINPRDIKSINVLKDASATAVYGPRAAGGVIIVTLKDKLDDYISVNDKALDVTFDIDLPYDIPTNGKAQIATLKEYDVPASYSFYAVPKLDNDVFLMADIIDWEKLNLLPGEANIILEGTYVGKSIIDPASIQDTLNLTLGRDKRIVITKETMKNLSSVKFLGTNKKQVLTYEITVKNNKKDAINISIKDQVPVSMNKEIEVELLEKSDAVYNEETGLLTWKLSLAAGEVKKIRMSYSIKYPKDKTLNQ